MDVNDNAGCLMPRVVLSPIASMLAPTGSQTHLPVNYLNSAFSVKQPEAKPLKQDYS